MNQVDISDEKIIRAMDLLEQIKDVNRMIEIHQKDGDDMMLRQYRFRREKFLKELSGILETFQIKAVDLAA